ncbi:hypothetical protein [uncultured Helicobacter sp.]|uniref:hypothetical protein n=1 Tax=uncultured Helicobacter sp. TaxID=175537 RepID=UPI003752D755
MPRDLVNFSESLQQMRGKILARYANNPYVLIGCGEECARVCENACVCCEAGKRVLKVVLIGTQAYLENLDMEKLERLARYGVQMEFVMQVAHACEGIFKDTPLQKYGVVFGIRIPKS